MRVASLLDEEKKKGKQASKPPSPWATATASKDAGGMTKPQLTQDWANALDKTGDKGASWHELTKQLPSA